eukprot:scaffold251_cov134-Isochrysis_galbana.AAC.2
MQGRALFSRPYLSPGAWLPFARSRPAREHGAVGSGVRVKDILRLPRCRTLAVTGWLACRHPASC